MRHLAIILFLVPLLGACGEPPAPEPSGNWSAWLDSPGGRLEFDLRVLGTEQGLSAEISGGEEVIGLSARFERGELLIEFPHFDATIAARFDPTEDRLDGEWRKYAGLEKWSALGFHAVRPVETPGDTGGLPSVEGRWAVDFESEEDPAVAILERGEPAGFTLRGTVLTTVGDYRYLWGDIDADGAVQLQAFDGAHAFLFKAQLQDDGSLAGEFWSRDSWHESWTAHRDDAAALPDAFALTRLETSVPLASLRYPDLEGQLRSLDDPAFAGKARIIEVFGTWCPNCYDATQYLKELRERYGNRGLSILGLAFELSGDLKRDTAQVRRYVQTQGIEYPILVAGTSDKAEASKAFPLIDRVRSYPTFLFIDGKGEVRSIYTGFSGPATGPAHAALRRSFERVIEELLDD